MISTPPRCLADLMNGIARDSQHNIFSDTAFASWGMRAITWASSLMVGAALIGKME